MLQTFWIYLYFSKIYKQTQQNGRPAYNGFTSRATHLPSLGHLWNNFCFVKLKTKYFIMIIHIIIISIEPDNVKYHKKFRFLNKLYILTKYLIFIII